MFLSVSRLLADHHLFQELVQDLKRGAVAAIPTDTLYGFAIDADSVFAFEKLYEIKGRDERKPLILFLPSIDGLSSLGITLNPDQSRFLQKFWPGAVTAVFPFPQRLFKAFPFDTLGIRIPDHLQLLSLLTKYPGYLLTTSANRSGQPAILDPEILRQEFGKEIPWIVDNGAIPLSEPSTVVDMSFWPPKILRQGKISF